MEKRNKDNFIMLPTVDFCFKELMRNPKVRRGFIAAVLGKNPSEIRKTTLIAAELDKESEDAKQGILDVKVEMEDETKINMEMQEAYFQFWPNRILFYLSKTYTGQIKAGEDYDALEIHILELQKLPPEDRSEDGIIRWMRFFGGKSREEFENMAKQDEYIEEAYDELKKLSADEKKRLEYEAWERAVLDYNSQMKSARMEGERIGEKLGEERGRRLAQVEIVEKMLARGMSREEIAELLGMDVEEVAKIIDGKN